MVRPLEVELQVIEQRLSELRHRAARERLAREVAGSRRAAGPVIGRGGLVAALRRWTGSALPALRGLGPWGMAEREQPAETTAACCDAGCCAH